MKRLSFQEVRYHADVIYALCYTAESFSLLLKQYLETNGWSEEEFNDAMIRSSEDIDLIVN